MGGSTGVHIQVVPPSPSCPSSLAPQHFTLPAHCWDERQWFKRTRPGHFHRSQCEWTTYFCRQPAAGIPDASGHDTPGSDGAPRFNPGKLIFLSFSGNKFYHTNALILLVKRICVVIFIARKQKKIIFPDEIRLTLEEL